VCVERKQKVQAGGELTSVKSVTRTTPGQLHSVSHGTLS